MKNTDYTLSCHGMQEIEREHISIREAWRYLIMLARRFRNYKGEDDDEIRRD